MINHLFFPPRLPNDSDESFTNSSKLCDFVLETAEKYDHLMVEPGSEEQAQWAHVVRMLRNFSIFNKTNVFSTHDLAEAFGGMLLKGT